MSKSAGKNLKSMAKQAKLRLKNGFWEDYKQNVDKKVELAEEEGVCTSNVISYYKAKASRTISGDMSGEAFYLKVKDILDRYGFVSDMLGRLCDAEYMKTLSFEQKQKYVFETSERYLACVERYMQEKQYSMEGNSRSAAGQ